MAKDDKKATARVVDMTNVKEGGQFSTVHHEPGDYPGKVVKVMDHTSKEGNDNWLVVFALEGRRGEYPYYCSTSGDGLWKIRNVYIAAGINVPKKKLKLDPGNQLIGRKLGITLDDDEYEGRMRSKVMGVLPLSELSDAGVEDSTEDDVEVDTPPAKPKKVKKNKKQKPSAAAVEDDELEELEIEDL